MNNNSIWNFSLPNSNSKQNNSKKLCLNKLIMNFNRKLNKIALNFKKKLIKFNSLSKNLTKLN